MSLDDWATKNIEDAARKQFFGKFEDPNEEEIWVVDTTTYNILKDDPYFIPMSDDSNEAPGIGDA